MKLRFSILNFSIFLIFLLIEVLIGVFIQDSFIRPFGGDFLIIFLVYYLVKAFIKISPLPLISFVLLFACLVETGQYFHIVDILGIKNKILRIIIGNSFSWGDILAYIAGAIVCYYIDSKIDKKEKDV